MPSLFDIANIIPKRDWRKTWLIRQERIKKEGSEYFPWEPPVIAPGVITSIEIAHEFPRARKYAPLDFIEVANNDVVDITLIINNAEELPVHSGVIRTVDNAALWQIGIRNEDAATDTTLHLIKISLRRQPVTIDDWARRGT